MSLEWENLSELRHVSEDEENHRQPKFTPGSMVSIRLVCSAIGIIIAVIGGMALVMWTIAPSDSERSDIDMMDAMLRQVTFDENTRELARISIIDSILGSEAS